MKRLLPPLLLGLMLTLSACTRAPVPSYSMLPSPSPTPAPGPTATATAAPEAAPPVWGVQTGEYRETVPGHPELMLVEGNFSLPYIENAAGVSAYEAVNRWYAKLMDGLKGDVAENMAIALDDFETSRSLDIPFLGYSDEESFELVYENGDMAVLLRTHYAHSSGPYPTLLYFADRFDLTTGAPLRFADFFTDPGGAEAAILAEIKRQGAERPQYDQEAVGSAFNREFFYPTEEGLLFFYQPQTLSPQAADKPEFLVPYSILEGFLSR